MYRYRKEVIAFRLFALKEIENLPNQKMPEHMNTERNLFVLSSVDFERKLLVKQLHMLDSVMSEASTFFLSFSEYLDNLRKQLKQEYIERRIEPTG